MSENANRFTPYLPWLAAVLLAAGAIVTLVTGSFELLNNLLLAGGALLLLLFAAARPDIIREFLGGRHARYGSSTLLSILFFAAIAVLLYWLAAQNEDWRLDTTETGQFTPAPEISALLEEMGEPVHVIGFYSPALAQQRDEARARLESLAAVSDRLTYEFQDPEVNPLLAEQYELNFNGTLVFTKGRDTGDEVFARANSLSDRDIYTALLKIASPAEKKVYFITGHGEPAVEGFAPEAMGTMVSLLEDQAFTVDTLNLFSTGAVPDDATAVALVGPQSPLDPIEVEALTAYLAGGGAALIARDVAESAGGLAVGEDGLDQYLQEAWGLTFRDDVIVDQDLARAGQTFGLDFLAATYGDSPIITEELRQFGTRFSLARSLALDAEAAVNHAQLVMTSPEAWGETDLLKLSEEGVAEPGPDDVEGVLTIGASAANPNTEARLVLFGDADFATNANLIWGGNSLLVSNSLNWLADDEVAIELAPREVVERTMVIPEQQLRLLRLASTWFGPLLMAVAGLVVWARRRQTTRI